MNLESNLDEKDREINMPSSPHLDKAVKVDGISKESESSFSEKEIDEGNVDTFKMD